ncbi:MAG: hypothetical protein ABFD18_11790 [Syntrophomonas sp.]
MLNFNKKLNLKVYNLPNSPAGISLKLEAKAKKKEILRSEVNDLSKQKEEQTKTERSNIVLDPFPATTDYQSADKPKDKKRKN